MRKHKGCYCGSQPLVKAVARGQWPAARVTVQALVLATVLQSQQLKCRALAPLLACLPLGPHPPSMLLGSRSSLGIRSWLWAEQHA